MMQDFQGIQKWKEGRWKNMNEEWHVVKEAICCMNIKFFFAGERQKIVRERSDALGDTITHCSYRRSLHEREVPQERITQNSEYQQAQLRVQWQIEELMVTSLSEKFPRNLSGRPAVISAQQ